VLADPSGGSARRLVLVPRDDAMPTDGSIVVVGGVLRPFDQAGVSPDVRTSANVDDETVLVARSVMIENGNDLVRAGGVTSSIARLSPRAGVSLAQAASQPARAISIAETSVRPTMLANLIDELAGQRVRVRSARVVGVISPQVFLIEPTTSFQMMMGTRDRVAVLLSGPGQLRVDAATLVGATVMISGVARTPLGLSVSREVPWPRELTRDYMRRLEIRAALLATSVQSPDGVELTTASPTP
jgi:hypothetical protein